LGDSGTIPERESFFQILGNTGAAFFYKNNQDVFILPVRKTIYLVDRNF
jgi:hypothetical protein